MSIISVDCIYCLTPQYVTPRKSGNRSILKKMLYNPTSGSTSSICIDCDVCKKAYSLTLVKDVKYWRPNIVPSNGVLEDTKRKLNDDSISWENVLCSITGIAEYPNGTVHIAFQICNIRGYFDGMKAQKIITLITMWRFDDE